ncbi:hypothetical protein ILYODFUR_031212 [Ilyodon furcidens]|uniref:Uncharacterized protein n=1 Tax=Ilyodon furcidens TaxID=33524 RepID=A0ABV0U9Z5_9TELE
MQHIRNNMVLDKVMVKHLELLFAADKGIFTGFGDNKSIHQTVICQTFINISAWIELPMTAQDRMDLSLLGVQPQACQKIKNRLDSSFDRKSLRSGPKCILRWAWSKSHYIKQLYKAFKVLGHQNIF